jgi:hypothetical protein
MGRKAKTDFTFEVINVKLLSNHRSGSDNYLKLMELLFEEKLHYKYFGDRHYILRTQFHYDAEGKTIIGGKIGSFIVLDNRQWLDINNMEVVEYEIPRDHFPGLKEATYYWIPDAHRFCVEKKSGFSINRIADYLRETLIKTIGPDEQIEVSTETSTDAIEEIISAKAIRKIQITISYSNQDTNTEAVAFMENQLRDMQARKLIMEIQPDHNASLSAKNKILNGSIGLARSNGRVVANVIDTNDIPKTIVTSDHPRSVTVQVENEDHTPGSVFRKIMSIFRP